MDPDDYSQYKLPVYVARNYTVEELITMGSKSIKNILSKTKKTRNYILGTADDAVPRIHEIPVVITADVLDEIPVVVAGEGELFEEPAAHDDPAAQDEPAPHDEPVAQDEPAVYEEQEELAAPEEQEENVSGRPKPMFNDNNESSVGASQEPETNGNTPKKKNDSCCIWNSSYHVSSRGCVLDP